MSIYVLRSGIADISWLTLYIDSPLLEESDSEVDVSERILKKFFISKNLEKRLLYMLINVFWHRIQNLSTIIVARMLI